MILFSRLRKTDMARIVDIQLGRLRTLLVDRKITLHLDQSAYEWLAAEGYDPIYGARPLKRVLQRSLQNSLAGLILEGTLRDGDDLDVTAGASGLMLNRRLSKAA